MRPEPDDAAAEHCPFLVPVMADSLWRFPMSAYCRRPGGNVHVPASRTTLPCICLTHAHLLCPGYLEGMAHHWTRTEHSGHPAWQRGCYQGGQSG